MCNCSCALNPPNYRVSANTKSESPKDQSPSVVKARNEESKPPTNPEEVEDFHRSSAVNPLIVFTYNELKKITGNFRQDHMLGGGGFGSVYKGLICEDEYHVLVYECIWLGVVWKTIYSQDIHTEEIIGCGIEQDRLYYVTEVAQQGTAVLAHGTEERQKWLWHRRLGVLLPLPWSIRMKIAFGAAKGLAFLHEAENPVIYRDFKTSNILLDPDYHSKLSDFGLEKDGPVGDKSHVSTRIMGTYGYADPEYIMTGHLTPRSDVYSYGVVLLELLTGRKSLDKSRPSREQNLTEWAVPMLKEKKKLVNIADPRLEGNYPKDFKR